MATYGAERIVSCYSSVSSMPEEDVYQMAVVIVPEILSIPAR